MATIHLAPQAGVTHIILACTSPVFGTDPTLTWNLVIEQDKGDGAGFVPWEQINGVGGSAGQVYKGQTSDGLPRLTFSYEPIDRMVRTTVTTNTPFVWGLTIDTLPTPL